MSETFKNICETNKQQPFFFPGLTGAFVFFYYACNLPRLAQERKSILTLDKTDWQKLEAGLETKCDTRDCR